MVEGKHQSYTICAAGAEERDSWIEAIRSDHTHVGRTHTQMAALYMNRQ